MRGEALLGVLVLGLLFLGSAYIASTKPERYPSYPFGPAVALGSIFVVIGLTGFIWNYHQSRKIVVPVKKEPIIIRARREEKAPSGHPTEKITRFCLNCSQVVASDVNFCSHCGKELGARAPKQRPLIPPLVKGEQKTARLLACIVNRRSLAREILEFVKKEHPEELEKSCISEEICELFWKTKGVVKENIQNPEILLKVKEAELAACRKLASESEPMNLISRLPGSAGQEIEQNKRINLLSTQPLQELKYEKRERAQKIKKEEVSIQVLKSGQKCPECTSNKLARDYELAEIVCMDCGFVGDAGKFIGARAQVKKPIIPKRVERRPSPLVEREFVGTYVSRRGKEISIYKEGRRFRIGKNTCVNQSFVNEVEEYLRKSGKSLSSKEIEKGLGKYYTYKAPDIQIWNALRVLISLGKVKRYGSGSNIRYKTTFVHYPSKPKEQPEVKHGVLVVDRKQEFEKEQHACMPVVGAFNRVVLGKKEILFIDEKTKNRRKKKWKKL